LRKFNVAYFAASCDTAEVNKRFAESLKLDYPILSDPDGEVARAYGVADDARKFPRRWTFFIGKDGKILFIDKGVVPKNHGDDSAKRLGDLKVEQAP
jgi:peroxiredoxin Q/BCP